MQQICNNCCGFTRLSREFTDRETIGMKGLYHVSLKRVEGKWYKSFINTYYLDIVFDEVGRVFHTSSILLNLLRRKLDLDIRSLEIGYAGWGCDREEPLYESIEIDCLLRTPTPERIIAIRNSAMIC